MKLLTAVFMGIFLLLFFSSFSYAYAPFGRLLCKTPGYACLKIARKQTWESLFPNSNQRMLVMQLNRMNTPLYTGMSIAVPVKLDQSSTLMDFSPFPSQIKSTGQKIIFIDPAVLAWAAYNSDGRLIRWGPASLGSDWCHDLGHRCHSPVGSFNVYQKGAYSCKSTKFPLPRGGAPMPYCMFFHRGFALHGEPGGLPGDNVSHGCVRLFVTDAEWLSTQFIDGPITKDKSPGTKVVIAPYGPFDSPDASSNINKLESTL